MKFAPKTEAEIKAATLIDPGTYDFEVVKSEDKVSNKGNEMIVVELKLFVNEKRTYRVRDWLLPHFERKLRHFCYATGLHNEYENGTLEDTMCLGRAGKVVVIHEFQDGHDPRVMVKDYCVVEGIERPKPPANKVPAVISKALNSDDEPPF